MWGLKSCHLLVLIGTCYTLRLQPLWMVPVGASVRPVPSPAHPDCCCWCKSEYPLDPWWACIEKGQKTGREDVNRWLPTEPVGVFGEISTWTAPQMQYTLWWLDPGKRRIHRAFVVKWFSSWLHNWLYSFTKKPYIISAVVTVGQHL